MRINKSLLTHLTFTHNRTLIEFRTAKNTLCEYSLRNLLAQKLSYSFVCLLVHSFVCINIIKSIGLYPIESFWVLMVRCFSVEHRVCVCVSSLESLYRCDCTYLYR